ncbi:hypothetical protein AQJ23_01090 [Streptomyces antibioticus]|nr:hypothetical protein AQJ23_01090 [Streptomyces antibioticus]
MRADTTFWDSLVFDGTDEMIAVFGAVDIVARDWAGDAVCPDRRFDEPGARLLPPGPSLSPLSVCRVSRRSR